MISSRLRKTKRIESLMDKWNERYPSELPVDVIGETHLQPFIDSIEAIFESIPETPEDTRFEAWLLNAAWIRLQRAAKATGYSSVTDMLEDYRLASTLESNLEVHIPEAFEKLLGRGSPLPLVVRGLTAVGSIVYRLLEAYPALRDQDWILKIDGQDFESVHQTVLPTQRLELVISGSA